MDAIDLATSWIERPVAKVAGSARLNPLPHAGTISVFLLAVVIVSGLYITLFFEYGHEASYRAVAAMEEHAIQRVVRAIHRYSSALLVLTTVVHAWRIFAAKRYVGGARRWRWATGIASLLLVWLAGVTGYWLVWDVRAQAINEVVIGFFGGTGFGVSLAVDQLGVVGERSGSGFLFIVWLAHVLLTVVIGWFVFRHVRRTKLPWLPAPHWMAIMGLPLLVVSLAVPLGMEPAADPGRLIGDLPLDPFVLFLLPPLLSDARWIAAAIILVVMVALFLLPRILTAGRGGRSVPAPIAIDPEACTGCELCVIDCPYDALTMELRPGAEVGDRSAGERVDPHDELAVVDPQRCVACGVCVGSCAFGAIDLPGWDPLPTAAELDVADRPVVIVCDRHGPVDDGPDGPVSHVVRCAGAVAPDTVASLVKRGATSVQFVGCAPGDCRYGIGNLVASERLGGQRSPHPPRAYAGGVTQDWVGVGRLGGAMARPGAHPEADIAQPPGGREAMLGAGAIAVVSVIGTVFATSAPFSSPQDGPSVRVVVDHEAGASLASGGDDGPPVGPLGDLDISIDGTSVAAVDVPGGSDGPWRAIVDVALSPDLVAGTETAETAELVVAAATTAAGTGGGTDVVATQSVSLGADARIVVDLTDAPPAPGVAEGRRIFNSRTGGCAVCHSVRPGDDGVGPTLAGVASVAGDRVAGLDAEGYLRQSILLPDQYVLPGWPAGQMLPIYRDRFSATELDAVIAYLLSLEGN